MEQPERPDLFDVIFHSDPGDDEALLEALQSLLVEPSHMRAFAVTGRERELLAGTLGRLRRRALETGSIQLEQASLKALLHLRLLNSTDRLRLAYLCSQSENIPPRFAVASLFMEYLARSAESPEPFEGYPQVRRALSDILDTNPRWSTLLTLQSEFRNAGNWNS
jgi:hypothetical protein